jgi:hypothetical protein
MPSKLLLLLFSLFCSCSLWAQPLTGVWKGRIGGQRAEVKFVQQGDSIRGTSYYYATGGSFRRYSIRGYRDEQTNAITWWDDQLLETKGGMLGVPGKLPLASAADFNCPGGGVMMLDGKAAPKEESGKETELHLDKTAHSQFPDEWDFVIDNYMVGANDPRIIDSVALIAFGQKPKVVAPQPAVVLQKPPKRGMVSIPPPPPEKKPEPAVDIAAAPKTIEEKFITRTPKHFMDIPLRGDSIELRFYDNAEIDGDSISLFLNKQLLFQHIRLTAKAHVIKLAVADMGEENELVMVAENLGKIPPNTSFMVALVGDMRYEANLQSTEEISALIRLQKPKKE